MNPAVYKVDMIKGQIWRNTRNGQLERINHTVYNEPTALTEHYLRARVSDPINKAELEKVSHKEAEAYVEEQRKFDKIGLPPLPISAGV